MLAPEKAPGKYSIQLLNFPASSDSAWTFHAACLPERGWLHLEARRIDSDCEDLLWWLIGAGVVFAVRGLIADSLMQAGGPNLPAVAQRGATSPPLLVKWLCLSLGRLVEDQADLIAQVSSGAPLPIHSLTRLP